MLETSLILGFLVALALLIMFYKLVGWKQILEHHILVDVVATLALGLMFAGTMHGLMVAIMAGLMISIGLMVARKTMPKPKPKPKYRKVAVYRDGVRVQ